MAIHLVINPRNDDELRGRVEGYMAAGASTPGELEHALREEYPHVVVRSRDLTGEPEIVWYVYREGRWVSGAH
jgi:hypothetical protein